MASFQHILNNGKCCFFVLHSFCLSLRQMQLNVVRVYADPTKLQQEKKVTYQFYHLSNF